ncbi:hypothetical protein WDZ16_12940 [Pseudokineococcus marinus]|uniref:Phage tail protein n=1 Tax=Pseudokineococcus marinus TaxID=351215 RepID=A0A849BF02_9ACTN|nr:hypothetical protein [Pseudokineococcus marinus]NNH21640.1 hypothetical protein [Pseudokineococcus marinus]
MAVAGARGNPRALSLGPGHLLMAPIGSEEPVDLSSPWPAAWGRIGYTEEGSTFNMETSFEDVPVAEELEPLDSAPTGRTGSVSFASAEVTTQSLRRAMNGGTITTGAGFKTFEPPELGEELYVMIGFESEDGKERHVWRKGKQTGSVEMARRKGAAKTTISNTFTLYKPDDGKKFFKSIISDEREPAA